MFRTVMSRGVSRLSSLSTTLSALLDRKPPGIKLREIDFAEVQAAMLLVIDNTCGSVHLRVRDRVTYASDIETLWFLRPEVLAAVGAHVGEAEAMTLLAEMSPLFQQARSSMAKPRRKGYRLPPPR
jgi:hypothetical protein